MRIAGEHTPFLHFFTEIALRYTYAAPIHSTMAETTGAAPSPPPPSALQPVATTAEAAEAASGARPESRRAAMVVIGNNGPPIEEKLTGYLKLQLAQGRRDVPTVWWAASTLPSTLFEAGAHGEGGGAYPPVNVFDAWVHTHQRLSRAVLVFDGPPEPLGLPPLATYYAPAPLPDANASAAMRARLLAHPSLVCAATRPGLEFVPRREPAAGGVGGVTHAGLYDRHQPLRCTRPWSLRVGSVVTLVHFDDYLGAAAVTSPAASPGAAAVAADDAIGVGSSGGGTARMGVGALGAASDFETGSILM